MEHAINGGVDELLKQGIPGLAIIALTWFCWRLFKLYVEVTEKRITEAVNSAAALAANTQALNALGELIKDRRTPV